MLACLIWVYGCSGTGVGGFLCDVVNFCFFYSVVFIFWMVNFNNNFINCVVVGFEVSRNVYVWVESRDGVGGRRRFG